MVNGTMRENYFFRRGRGLCPSFNFSIEKGVSEAGSASIYLA
jgi:hypothetical protein